MVTDHLGSPLRVETLSFQEAADFSPQEWLVWLIAINPQWPIPTFAGRLPCRSDEGPGLLADQLASTPRAKKHLSRMRDGDTREARFRLDLDQSDLPLLSACR